MEIVRPLQRFCRVQIQRLLVLVIGVAVVLIVLAQLTSLSYKSYLFVKLPVTEGILVNEVAFFDNTSTANEGALNESKVEEGCNVYDCENSGQMGQTDAMKQNDSSQTSQTVAVKQIDSAQTGQTIAVKSNDSRPWAQTVTAKQNDYGQTGQTGQTGVVALKPTRLNYMISILEETRAASFSKPKSISAHDRQLQLAKVKIENAPLLRNTEGLHASLYHNVSKFLRSYKLMENTLKVYIYKEGNKPVFHDAKLRGIYASEGWFMNLMEKNRKFVVKDPKKAHLFYLPFSSLKLRNTSQEQNPRTHKELEQHLKDYITTISGKYPFWNRTNGTDHFLVACHDWAMKLTRNHMGNCIRSLCNSNLAGGFKIGKDTTLPATYIRSGQDPVKDIGGNPVSERQILAFFSGGMHGNLRPILLKHWQDKEPDMKIVGPMARDIESKARYRTYMKSSKYCICARGYEVYSPRIVESIYYECVPVIISDNYVPPFFEVLDWGAFAVFVLEKDVVNLGDILRSISEEKYVEMQKRVKMVQQHFIWHKMPIKYDLFHMILHSIWNNRLLQVRA